MARFRTAALTILAAFIGFAIVSAAAAQSNSFARCPKTAEQYNDVMKALVAHTEKARALAEDNPLLLADVGFYEAELKATRQCTPVVATAAPATR